MERFFNTAGPQKPDINYTIDPLSRFDLDDILTLIRKPLTDHYGGPVQRVVLELKIKRGSLDTLIDEGLRQTSDYMDIAGPVDEGHLIIFDRTGKLSWDDRIWHKPYPFQNRTIMVWAM